jgi:glutamyl-tRNA reductase
VGATEIRICNRSVERAVALARDLEASARPWEELEDCLAWADIAITSTAAPEPVIGSRLLAGVVRARRYRPLFLIDIAVPRDVEPEAAKLNNVYVYDLDSLNEALAENLAERARAAQGAESLIQREVASFLSWKQGLVAVPTIRDLREHFVRAARSQEADLLAALPSLDERGRAQVRAAMDTLVNRLLHAPLTALRRAGAEGNGVELLSATRRLFELGPSTPRADERDEK